MQCLRDVKKIQRENAKNSSESSDKSENDVGLKNLMSCDRLNQWKTVVTCTIDCMGQKIGMVSFLFK